MTSVSVLAQTDSCTIIQRLSQNQVTQNKFISFIYANPATHYDAYKQELTELSVSISDTRMDKPVLQQEGRGYTNKAFDASSFIKLSPTSRVWGEVNYVNGIKRGVKWNESADYTLVYPYVMGDSVGGKLNCEEYYFLGGYAHQSTRMGWGIQSSYRALLEYRNVDPRPRNITSDLWINAGVSYLINTRYQLGTMLLLNKYKQTNDVQFLSELGKSQVYHFTGLGMDYNRFLGTNTSAYYNGGTYGVSLSLSPADKGDGFYSSMTYRCFSFEKILSGLNELPLAQLNEHSFSSQVAYRKHFSHSDWGVKSTLDYKNRIGTENLFGDASATIYPQIGSVEQFTDRVLRTSLSFYYATTLQSNSKLLIMPSLSYNDKTVNYKYPKLWLSRSSVETNLLTEYSSRFTNSFLRLMVEGNYNNVLQTEMNIFNLGQGKLAVKEMMNSNWAFFSSNHFKLSLQPRYDLSLSGSKAIFVRAKWERNWYHSLQSFNSFELGCGITF